MLGGSSSINGMVYVRGNALDFDRWEEEGAAGWAYRDVLPYFRRAETRAEGGDDYRGGDGPLHDALRHACEPALPRLRRGGARRPAIRATDDVNGYQQEGFGRMDMTVHAAAAGAPPTPICGRRMKRAEPRGADARARDAASSSRAAAPPASTIASGGDEHAAHGAARGDPRRRRRSTRRSC